MEASTPVLRLTLTASPLPTAGDEGPQSTDSHGDLWEIDNQVPVFEDVSQLDSQEEGSEDQDFVNFSFFSFSNSDIEFQSRIKTNISDPPPSLLPKSLEQVFCDSYQNDLPSSSHTQTDGEQLNNKARVRKLQFQSMHSKIEEEEKQQIFWQYDPDLQKQVGKLQIHDYQHQTRVKASIPTVLLLSDNEMPNDKSFEHMNPDEEKGNNF